MLKYQIGRIEGRWRNFLPPIQGGMFEPYTAETSTTSEQGEDEACSSGSSSRSRTPIFDAMKNSSDFTQRRRKEIHETSSVSSFSSIELPPSSQCGKLSLMDARTQQEIDLDLAKYPALDPTT